MSRYLNKYLLAKGIRCLFKAHVYKTKKTTVLYHE